MYPKYKLSQLICVTKPAVLQGNCMKDQIARFCRVSARETEFGADVRQRSSWTDLSYQRIKLVGKIPLARAGDGGLSLVDKFDVRQHSPG